MTEPLQPRRGRRRRRMPLAAGASLGALCWVVLGASLSGCGASSALSSAVLAPLSVLPDTDVVLETNLQAAVQGGLVSGGISGPGGAGAPEVSGPPTTASEVSVATTGTVSVYTAFNPVDRHCLGTFVLKPGSFTTVLGVSTAGTYDFWFGPTTSAACASNLFTTATTVPKGWATGDPASGWPLP